MFNKLVLKAEKSFETFFSKRSWLLYILFTFIVMCFNWVLFVNFNKTTTGDFDYFAQAYEAIRKTILEYHQFPWVNSWVGGGVPLYANPQVGVFSIQTIFVLLFGVIYGLKISLIVYSLVGFWSFYILARSIIKTSIAVSLCLSMIWIINGFFMSHYIGHYTFALFQIFPLLYYLAINITKPKYWIYLSGILCMMTLSALHYAVLQSLLALFIIVFINLIQDKQNLKKKLTLYLKAILLFMLVCSHRIIYTLDYVLDFPRSFNDPANGVTVLLKTFIIPPDPSRGFYTSFIKPATTPELSPYAWGEFNAFIGLAVTLAFILSILALFYPIKKDAKKKLLYLLAIIVFFFFVAVGDFVKWSPHTLIHLLPGFSGMRVASRWLIWVIFFGLIFIGYSLVFSKGRTYGNILKVLILIGAIEIFVINIPISNVFLIETTQNRASTSRFEQYDNYDHFNQPNSVNPYKQRTTLDRRYESYGLEGTANNYGESRGYEPLADSRFTPTARCGINNGCQFVLSKNANVLKWSPGEIILKRTDEGPIEINMNPSNYWLVSGDRTFESGKVVVVDEKFIIKDEATIITLRVQPKTILEIIQHKIDAGMSKIKIFLKNHFL